MSSGDQAHTNDSEELYITTALQPLSLSPPSKSGGLHAPDSEMQEHTASRVSSVYGYPVLGDEATFDFTQIQGDGMDDSSLQSGSFSNYRARSQVSPVNYRRPYQRKTTAVASQASVSSFTGGGSFQLLQQGTAVPHLDSMKPPNADSLANSTSATTNAVCDTGTDLSKGSVSPIDPTYIAFGEHQRTSSGQPFSSNLVPTTASTKQRSLAHQVVSVSLMPLGSLVDVRPPPSFLAAGRNLWISAVFASPSAAKWSSTSYTEHYSVTRDCQTSSTTGSSRAVDTGPIFR